MEKRILNVIELGYTSKLDEKDDPVVWLVRTLDRASAKLDVLLGARAVSYAAAAPVTGSDRKRPRLLEQSMRALIDGGVSVFLVREDAAERGLDPKDLMAGVKAISRGSLPRLLESYPLIWRW